MAMPATQVHAHLAVSERIRNVLGSCQYARTAQEYARQVVEALAVATRSPHAVWMNWPFEEGILSQADGSDALACLLQLCKHAPLLSNEIAPGFGIHSLAAAPVLFRSTTAGVLAVGGSSRPYTTSDLELLEEVGRAALPQYESLVHTESLGITTAARRLADLAHDLRQPLGTLEASTFYLDLILPEEETKAREQLSEMQSQLDAASRLLDESTQGYFSRGPRPAHTEAVPEAEEESFVFTN
jgi:signal transduction histidine kinase